MIAGLSACGPHHAGNTSAAASKAAASARAFASSSTAAADKRKAKADLTTCITQVGVVKLTLHPVKSYPAFKTCLESHATGGKAQFDTCLNTLVGTAGLGAGKLVSYENGIANCLVAAPSSSPTS
jgi:hypothetical protein